MTKSKNLKMKIPKKTMIMTNNLELNVNFQDKPVLTLILLCISKPDVAFIILCYASIYIIIFCILMVKLYGVYLNAYNSTISKISPETIQYIDYYYNYFKNIVYQGISLIRYNYITNEIKQIEYVQNDYL